MADTRKEFEVDINGVPHVMLLDPEDAQALYGDSASEVKGGSVANKSRTPADKEG